MKAFFDWHNPDDNETVLLPLLQSLCLFVTFIELKRVNVCNAANSKFKKFVYNLRGSSEKFFGRNRR